MAVNFVVEDGTGKVNSTSYIDIDFANDYSLAFGDEFNQLSDDVKKVALNKATRDIDNYFDFFGRKTKKEQNLQFPRINCLDSKFNEYLESDEIPIDLKKATADLAVNIALDGIQVFKNAEQPLKTEKIDVLTFENFTSELKPMRIPVVESLLADISFRKGVRPIKLVRC